MQKIICVMVIASKVIPVCFIYLFILGAGGRLYVVL